MCRHCEACELLVDCAPNKQLMHDFMELSAKQINRKLIDQGIEMSRKITADDIDLEIKVGAQEFRLNPFEVNPSAVRLIRDEMNKLTKREAVTRPEFKSVD